MKRIVVFTDALQQVAVNHVTSDNESFRGTPAVSDGRLIVRSSQYLYCVSDKGETVPADKTVITKAEEEAAPATSGAGRRGGNGRFDPMSMINGIVTD